MKENQELKYLNEGSAHTKATFKSIPSGVLRRLSVLTSLTPETENEPLNKLYPFHAAALEEAGLPTPKIYPTLLEALKEIEERKIGANAEAQSADENEDDSQSAAAKRKRDRERSTFFCVGFSNVWGEPIHKCLKRLRDKHGITWLRIAMSYHKFSNLGEKLHNDLSSKVMKGIIDREEQDLPCNCPKKCRKEDGTCLHNDQC